MFLRKPDPCFSAVMSHGVMFGTRGWGCASLLRASGTLTDSAATNRSATNQISNYDSATPRFSNQAVRFSNHTKQYDSATTLQPLRDSATKMTDAATKLHDSTTRMWFRNCTIQKCVVPPLICSMKAFVKKSTQSLTLIGEESRGMKHVDIGRATKKPLFKAINKE